MKPNIADLKRRSKARAEELRQARPRLHFGDCPKPLPRLHAEDAGAGLDDKPYLPRRLG